MFNHDYQTKEVEMQSFVSGKTNLIGRLDFIKKISDSIHETNTRPP